MKITTKKLNNSSYELIFNDKKSVGILQMQDNGFFTYEGLEAWALKEIANKLDEINRPLDDSIKKYFKDNKTINNCSCGRGIKMDGDFYCKECLTENPLLCT